MKKNNYKIKKLFIIFFILFCFIFISLEQTFSVKLEKNAQYSPFIFSSNQPLLFFCFGTDPLNYPTLQFSLVDLDLAIKFLFNDEKIPFESLQDEYDQLRLKYKSLLEAQFQGFKYYFAKELRQIKI